MCGFWSVSRGVTCKAVRSKSLLSSESKNKGQTNWWVTCYHCDRLCNRFCPENYFLLGPGKVGIYSCCGYFFQETSPLSSGLILLIYKMYPFNTIKMKAFLSVVDPGFPAGGANLIRGAPTPDVATFHKIYVSKCALGLPMPTVDVVCSFISKFANVSGKI